MKSLRIAIVFNTIYWGGYIILWALGSFLQWELLPILPTGEHGVAVRAGMIMWVVITLFIMFGKEEKIKNHNVPECADTSHLSAAAKKEIMKHNPPR